MKIVFFGTPAFAKEFLTALHAEDDFSIEAVVCQPDKPVGRKQIMTPPETKIFALEHKIPVLQPVSLKKQDTVDAIAEIGADLFVVVAYGKIIPQAILNLSKLGCVNVHPSLLPKYRGPSPIQSAILNQEPITGVSIMLLDAEMDHGPILAQEPIELDANETSITLRKKVTEMAPRLLVKTIKKLAAGEINPQAQDDTQATICKIFEKSDGKIDWNAPAEKIYAQHRALIEWPGVYTIWDRNDQASTIKILDLIISDRNLIPGHIEIDQNRLFIGTGTSAIEVLELQPESGSKMTASAFIQGHKDIQTVS